MTEKTGTTAEILTQLHTIPITACDGGFHIKNTPHGNIYVLRMLFNWRITRQPPGTLTYDRGWCYYGNDVISLLRTVRAAVSWDGEDTTEPEGWNKNAFTGQYARG